MPKVEINFLRSDGETFAIDETVWKLFSDGLNGLDGTMYNLFQNSNYVGEGTLFVGGKLMPREFTFFANLIEKSYLKPAREQAISFFNPNYSYSIYITYLDKIRLIKGKIIGFNMPTGNINKVTTLRITFLSESPYLLSRDMTQVLLTDSTKKFTFPYFSGTEEGFEFGEILGSEKNIVNDGDFPCGFIAEVECAGTASGLTIVLNEKEVTYKGTLLVGDKLILNFDNIPTTVTKNGINDIKNIDKQSNFNDMKFIVGNNTISYNATSGVNNLKIYIKYFKNYNGV